MKYLEYDVIKIYFLNIILNINKRVITFNFFNFKNIYTHIYIYFQNPYQ